MTKQVVKVSFFIRNVTVKTTYHMQQLSNLLYMHFSGKILIISEPEYKCKKLYLVYQKGLLIACSKKCKLYLKVKSLSNIYETTKTNDTRKI